MICVGVTDALEANSSFSEQVIVHGYTRQSERAVQRTNLRSEIHFAFLMIVAGIGMAGAGLCGFFTSADRTAPGLPARRRRPAAAHELVACASCQNLSMEMPSAAVPPRPDFIGNKR